MQSIALHMALLMSPMFSCAMEYPNTANTPITASGTYHSNTIHNVQFSPNGKYILAASADGTTNIWDATTYELIKTLSLDIGAGVFTPDGEHILIPYAQQEKGLFSIAANSYEKSILNSRYATPIFLKNNNHLLLAEDNTIQLLDAKSGIIIRDFPVLKGIIDTVSISFSSDIPRMLVLSSTNPTLRSEVLVWEMKTGQLIRTLEYNRQPTTQSFSGPVLFTAMISPDGQYFITGGTENNLLLWDIATGQVIRQFHTTFNLIRTAVFSPSGKYIAAGGDFGDKDIYVWEFATGKLLTTLSGHEDAPASLAFSPDDNYLVSGGYDNRVILWKLHEQPYPIIRSDKPLTDVAFTADSQRLYLAHGTPEIDLIDIKTGAIMSTIKEKWPVETIKAAYPSNLLMAMPNPWKSNAFNLRYLDTGEPAWQASPARPTPAVHSQMSSVRYEYYLCPSWEKENGCIAYKPVLSPQEELLLVTGSDLIQIWKGPNLKLAKWFRQPPGVFVDKKAFSPDGRYLAFSYPDALNNQSMAVVDSATGNQIKTFPADNGFEWGDGLTFSPDSKYLAATFSNCVTKVFKTDTWESVWENVWGKHELTRLTYSPDGKQMAAGHDTLYLFDSATGSLLKSLHINGRIAGYSPNGAYIATISNDGVRLIPSDPNAFPKVLADPASTGQCRSREDED